MADLKELFNVFDQNGDGVISRKELESLMKELGTSPSEADIDEMMKEADIDGNGNISFEEFVKMCKKNNIG